MWNHFPASGENQRVKPSWPKTREQEIPHSQTEIWAIHRPGSNSYSHFIIYELASVLTKTTTSFLRWEPHDSRMCHQVPAIKGPYHLLPDHTEDQASNTWILGTPAMSKLQHRWKGPIEKCRTRRPWDGQEWARVGSRPGWKGTLSRGRKASAADMQRWDGGQGCCHLSKCAKLESLR